MDAGRSAAIGINPPPTPTSPTETPLENMMSILATAISSATASTPSSFSSSSAAAPPNPHDPEGECRLLGSFALLVQAALGGLALLSLVYKRWRERPQRPIKIWFFDVSKQVFGSVLVHIANIFMSMLTSGEFSITATSAAAAAANEDNARRNQPYIPNPCSFYLLNLAIDTTLGIPILILLLRLITAIVSFTPLGKPLESIQSGNYGHPPSAWWWLKQSVIYFCGLFGMKICVLVIFIAMPWISKVGDWALSWTDGNEKLQIAFVMMIFPLIMNGLQYYIIDSFIKKPITEEDVVVVVAGEEEENDDDGDDDDDEYEYDDNEHEHGRVGRRHDEERRVASARGRGRFTQIANDDGSDSDDEAEEEDKQPATTRTRTKTKTKRTRPISAAEYDPDVDGDAPTVIGSSSSSQRKVTMAANPKS